MSTTKSIAEITKILEEVTDPEVPVLTIADLGILRGVEEKDGQLQIPITPTFTGCPAMRVIEEDINRVLNSHGITNFKQ